MKQGFLVLSTWIVFLAVLVTPQSHADTAEPTSEIIETAEKYLRHELSLSNLKSTVPDLFSRLQKSAQVSKSIAMLPAPFLKLIENDLHANKRGAIRLVMLFDCIATSNNTTCRERYGHNPKAYAQDKLAENLNRNSDIDSLVDESLSEFWLTEVFLQTFLRSNNLDDENKVYYLNLFYDAEIAIPRWTQAYEYAVKELSKSTFFTLNTKDSESLSIRRWVIINDYLKSLGSDPAKLAVAVQILHEEYRKNEYRNLADLDHLILALAKDSIPQEAVYQYLVLNEILRKEHLNWPFSFLWTELRQRVSILVSECEVSAEDCAYIKAIHQVFSGGDSLAIQDLQKSSALLDGAITQLKRSEFDNQPVAKLMAEILPSLHAIGAARSKGDMATVIQKSTLLRKRILKARKDPELSAYRTELGFYELLFINDEFSVGRTQKALADARNLLAWVENIENPLRLQARTEELIISIKGFISRAETDSQGDETNKKLSKEELQLQAWRSNYSLIDRLKAFNAAFSAHDVDGAAILLSEIQKQYATIVKNGNAISSFAFSSFLETRERLLEQKRAGLNASVLQETIFAGDIYLIVAAIIGDLFSAEARVADQRAWAINFQASSPRLSNFYSKLYINSIHANLNNLNEALGVRQHDYVGTRSAFIKEFASKMIKLGDYAQAFNALSILDDLEHREFLNIERLTNQKEFLIFDPNEAKLLALLERRSTELSVLVREFLRDERGKRSGDLLSKINTIERELFMRLRQFANAADETRSDLAQFSGAPTGAAQLAIVSHDGYVEVFGQYEGRKSSARVGIAQRELRIRAFKDYSLLSKPATLTSGLSFSTISILQNSVSSVLEALAIPKYRSIYVTLDDALGILPVHSIVPQDIWFRYSFIRNIIISKPVSGKIPVRKSKTFFGVTKSHQGLPALTGVIDEERGFRKAFALNDEKIESFLDQQYSRETFKQALFSDGQIIHLASHFLLNTDSLRDSRFLLGDGKFLAVSELFKPSVRMDGIALLTLAACETGTSNQISATSFRGFKGVGTEFVRFGVKNVIASLWRVSDQSTANFFKVFYYLTGIKGMPPSDALREAQRIFYEKELIELADQAVVRESLGPSHAKIRESMRHPFHWSGFVLFSSPR